MGGTQGDHPGSMLAAILAQPGTDGESSHAVTHQCHPVLPGLLAQCLHCLFHQRGVIVNRGKHWLQINHQHRMPLCLQSRCHIVPEEVVAHIAMHQQYRNARLRAAWQLHDWCGKSPGLAQQKHPDTALAFTPYGPPPMGCGLVGGVRYQHGVDDRDQGKFHRQGEDLGHYPDQLH
jgi:hypothetical protein